MPFIMDIYSKEKRSEIMRSVRSKDTTPEKRIRSLLHLHGYRFRLYRKDLPGTPDIVLPKYKLVIFVHGCFWHRHQGCRKSSIPKTNKEFWIQKFNNNIVRDKIVKDKLESLGWKVVVIWSCETNNDDLVLEKII